ncbi:MAG: cyclase family protein [Oscillospiraceae bacterium]
MKIIDISNDLLTAEGYEGDPIPEIVEVKSMKKGDTCNLNALYTGLHNGTHIDAPLHFIDDGKSIEEMPLDAFIGECTVLSVGAGIITGEIVENIFPRKCERLLIKSNGRAFIHETAAQEMAYLGYKLIGTDGVTIEPEFGNGKAHKALLSENIAILEGINLSAVADGNYFLIAPPIKISEAEAAPSRAILISDYVFWSGKADVGGKI